MPLIFSSAGHDGHGNLSMAERVALVPDPARRAEILAELSEQDADLEHSPAFWLRPNDQLAAINSLLPVVLMMSGRGGGKTRTGSNKTIQKAKEMPGSRIHLVGRTVADVRDTMVQGESGILALSSPDFMPTYVPSIRKLIWPNSSVAITFCTTPEHEALTRSGWVTHDQLRVGDEILTLNVHTGVSEWQPVEAVNVFDVTNELMCEVDMNFHHSITTFDHRWPVMHRLDGTRRMVDSILDFTSKDSFIVAAPCADLPAESKYTDAMVELVAWWSSEGSLLGVEDKTRRSYCVDREGFMALLTKRREYLGWDRADHMAAMGRPRGNTTMLKIENQKSIRPEFRAKMARALGLVDSAFDKFFAASDRRQAGVISQCPRTNPDHVVAIRRVLTELFGPATESLVGSREPAWKEVFDGRLQRFFLTQEVIHLLEEHAPGFDKVVSLDFVNSLTRSQLELYIRRFMDGDGHQLEHSARTVQREAESGWVLAQGVFERLDSVEHAAVLLGWAVRRSTKFATLLVRPTVPTARPAKRRVVEMEELRVISDPRDWHPTHPSNGERRTIIEHTGKVWCPTTANRTWLCRHDGTVFYTGNSSETPDQLRGPQSHFTWADELAAFKLTRTDVNIWDQIQISTRLGEHPQIFVTTTPKRIPLIKELVERAERPNSDLLIVTGSTYDNRANLSSEYLQTLIDLYAGTALEEQELYGRLVLVVEGSLWKDRDFIIAPLPEIWNTSDKFAVTDDPQKQLEFVTVIAVDPSASSGGDETGIVRIQSTRNRHEHISQRRAWVTADRSLQGSPEQWAKTVADLYHETNEDHLTVVVAEKNQGGEMVRTVIQSADPAIPVALIPSVRSKAARAEPVVLAYRRGRVFHVENFPELEAQLTEWEPDSKWSPDRLDALVHGLTTLLIDDRPIRPYGRVTIGSANLQQLDGVNSRARREIGTANLGSWRGGGRSVISSSPEHYGR